jgi:hypothetical protein
LNILLLPKVKGIIISIIKKNGRRYESFFKTNLRGILDIKSTVIANKNPENTLSVLRTNERLNPVVKRAAVLYLASHLWTGEER